MRGMKRIILAIGGVAILIVLAVFLYGAVGFVDAVRNADRFAARADRLIADNRGAEGLGGGRIEQLLQVQDPGFYDHEGVDLSTAGSGLTTMTQSLAKRLGFEDFQPGIGKIRQTGFAMGLERELTKPQIIALFLDTVEMGRGPNGWMTGFFQASQDIYARPPSALDDEAFLSLVAVMIAPGRFDLQTADADLDERVRRIQLLVSGRCSPQDQGDVWLEGCLFPAD